MLILVSTCFLLFNAPFHICTVGLKIYTVRQSTLVDRPLNHTVTTDSELTSELRRMEFFYLLVVITQYVSYASYSINFFLYSLCGMKFRRELVRFISKQRQQLSAPRSLTLQNTL